MVQPPKYKGTEKVGQDRQVKAAGTEMSKEAEAILKGEGKYAPTPMNHCPDRTKSNATTTSSGKRSTVDIAPEYDGGNDAEDGAKDSLDVGDCKDPSIIGPPELPASATRGKRKRDNCQNRSSMSPHELPASAARGKKKKDDSQTSSSMGSPGLPASPTRGNQKATVDQGAGTVPPSQGKKYWSMDDLPVERYTPDGRRLW